MSLDRKEAEREERARWVSWLYDIGYGIDFGNDIAPPCAAMDLAREYHRREGYSDETPEDYLGNILYSYGWGKA
ncbi:MAG: hypothetical protein NVSMB4_07310 [Acidimicrobiales bacterium]